MSYILLSENGLEWVEEEEQNKEENESFDQSRKRV